MLKFNIYLIYNYSFYLKFKLIVNVLKNVNVFDDN